MARRAPRRTIASTPKRSNALSDRKLKRTMGMRMATALAIQPGVVVADERRADLSRGRGGPRRVSCSIHAEPLPGVSP